MSRMCRASPKFYSQTTPPYVLPAVEARCESDAGADPEVYVAQPGKRPADIVACEPSGMLSAVGRGSATQ